MLIEQAFFSLPEVLHGSGYQQQDYESGIVGAFTLSLLQVLNGRNVPNPIGCLQSEKMFRTGGDFPGCTNPRYLRADLFVDVSRMTVANRRLAQYGWRHNAWLEGKFLRRPTAAPNTHSPNKTSAVASFAADLIRLAVLVPDKVGEQSIAGRYFLHVYDQPPEYFLTFRDRIWCKRICTEGAQTIMLENFGNEPATMRRLLGDMGNLSVSLSVTNFVARPIVSVHRPVYWCYLTRIDSVQATLGDHSFKIAADRNVTSQSEDSLTRLAAHVASRLHIAPDSRETIAAPEVENDEPDAALGQQDV
jgi:hypothetical protein